MLYKRGKIWWVRFKSKGVPIRESTGESDRAKAEVEAARIRIAEDKRPGIGRGQRATLEQVSAADIARAEDDRVTQDQITAIERQWRHVLAHFGATSDPAKIDYRAIEDYLRVRKSQTYAKAKNAYRGQSLRREVQCLKRGLAIAKRRDWIDSYPESWPRVKSDPMKRGQAGKWHPVEVIRDWLAVMDPMARLHATCVVLTGLRAKEMSRGELSWLEPAPPGFGTAQVVRVPSSSDKTRRGRVIPVTEHAARLLCAYWGAQDRPKSHRTARELARKRIKYGQDITLRDLRHVCGTIAEQHDRKAAQDILGHTTERMTTRYLHSDPERLGATSASVATSILGPEGAQRQGAQFLGESSKYGGRRGFRTPDIVRVSHGAPSDYSNLHAIEDVFEQRNHSGNTEADHNPGAQENALGGKPKS